MEDRTILKALDQTLGELQRVVDQVEVHDKREEYRQASESFPSPTQAFVYADPDREDDFEDDLNPELERLGDQLLVIVQAESSTGPTTDSTAEPNTQ